MPCPTTTGSTSTGRGASSCSAGPTRSRAGNWREIQVPGAWTMQDTFDKPHYTNVQMPFAGQSHRTFPRLNPTGIYERTFELPAVWAGRRVVLQVGAAESVLVVDVNGHEIGLSKDSHLAAEFDLTDIRDRRPEHDPAAGDQVVGRDLHRGPGRVVARRDHPLGLPVRNRARSTWPRSGRSAAWPTDLATGTLEFRAEVGFAGVSPEPRLGRRGDRRRSRRARRSAGGLGRSDRGGLQRPRARRATPAEREVQARHAYGGTADRARGDGRVARPRGAHRPAARRAGGLASRDPGGPSRGRPRSPNLYPLVVRLRDPSGGLVEEARPPDRLPAGRDPRPRAAPERPGRS